MTRVDKLLRLVHERCPSPWIVAFLREKKRLGKDVRLAAESTSTLILTNLRSAIARGSVSIEEVIDLLRAAEENSNCRIFYYTPQNRQYVSSLTLSGLATRLFGSRWPGLLNFPSFVSRTNKPRAYWFSDLRPYHPSKPRDWVLKLYGTDYVEIFKGETSKSANRVVKEFQIETTHRVIVIRWNFPNLLEIRVPRDDSRRRTDQWLDTAWNMVEGGLERGDFKEWNIGRAMLNIVRAPENDSYKREIRQCSFLDARGNAISLSSDYQSTVTSTARAIVQLPSTVPLRVIHLDVTWLLPNHVDPSNTVHTFLGGRNLNEVAVLGYLQPVDVDHITDQLRQLNRTRAYAHFFSCFISYSTKDKEFATRLHSDLTKRGVSCWFAPHDIRGGKKLYEQLDEQIRMRDRVLLILSDNSMKSGWVRTEIAQAVKKELSEHRQVLFPIGLAPFDEIRNWSYVDADSGEDWLRRIREYFISDFSNWKDKDSYADAFQRLLRDLQADEVAIE